MSQFDNGARLGNGSRDVRTEGTSPRDFVRWQNFVPREREERPYLYTNYDKNITKLNVNLQIDSLSDTKSFSSASENKRGKSKMGTPLPLTITFEIRIGRVDGDGNVVEGPAKFTTRAGKGVTVGNGNGRVSVTGIITSTYTISLEDIDLYPLEDGFLYNYLEVKKLEYETISNLVSRDGGVHSIIERGSEKFLYPSCCTVGTSIDSRYYPDVPERTFRLKGKKVLIPSNYTPLEPNGIDRRFSDDGSTEGNVIYNGPWDGSFKFGWTDNPAWIYYDLLVNTRYGIGAKLRDTNVVDKWSLYEIGMYCDAVTLNDGGPSTAGVFVGLDDGFGGLEPRFSCNIIIKDQKNAIDVLQDLSKTFAAMTYYNNSSVGVRVDRPYFFQDFNRTNAFEESLTATFPESSEFVPPKDLKFPPHLIFNNGTIKDGQFVYADTDRTQKLSAIEVSYLDKRSNFTPKTEYVEDVEAVKNVGINLKQMPGIGVTSRGQANRLAKYLLFESSHATETVSFNVGFEGLLLQPGDIIQVDDEMKNFSKNFGTILKTSGETYYYDPDSTTQGLANIQKGLGPKSIIVEPSIDSDQLDFISEGNIHIYNGIGRSGIDEFYKNPTVDNELYQKIHNPQMISLKIVQGGSGLSYDIVDEGVAIHIDSVGTFAGLSSSTDTNAPSQWFSEKLPNIAAGSRYSIDISGRSPDYYRVINVKENPDFGYDVIGLIHHTGKFKFIEENISFDLDADTFQPEFTLTEVTKPIEPTQVTLGAFSSNLDGSLNLPITITHAPALPGERFVVFLEEPNTNQVISKFDRLAGATTTVTLSGESRIDQIGEYVINVFSENITPVLSRSFGAATVVFTTQPSHFGLNTSTDAFIEYSNINILTDIVSGSTYNNVAETGFGQITFAENDPLINATFNMTFEDVFGTDEDEVLRSVSGQVVNLLDTQGNLKKANFKTLTNETSFTVTNEELNTEFGYDGSGLYRMPSGLKFQGDFFTLSGSGDLGTDGQFVQFEGGLGFYDEPPMVFIQQIVDGYFEDADGLVTSQKPIGRVRTTTSGFYVTGLSEGQNNYCYFASPVGVFKFDNNTKTIQVGKFNKNQTSSFMTVDFDENFPSTPRIITQLQQRDESVESLFCTTDTQAAWVDDFEMNAFDESGNAFAGSGIFGYIATTIESFNILLNGVLPFNSINIASDADNSFNTTGDQVLQAFNGPDYRYDNNNQMLFVQKNNNQYPEQFIVVHRTGDANKAIAYPMYTGNDESGIRFKNEDGAINNINLSGDFEQATSYGLENNFLSTAGFEILLTGDLAAGDTRFYFQNTTLGSNSSAIIELASTIPSGASFDVDIDIAQETGSASIQFTNSLNAVISESRTLSLGPQTVSFNLTDDAVGFKVGLLGGAPSSNVSGNSINIYSGQNLEYKNDISLVAWARFSENLTGKQYLMEYSNGSVGIAWFQSGDGKNYVNINGTDFKAIDTPINDNALHMLQIAIDRDVAMTGYLDGASDHTNTGITGAGFTGNLYPNKNDKTLLGNSSSLVGDAFTQGHIMNYVAFVTGELVTGDYSNDANSFFTGYTGSSNTDFIVALSGDNYPTFTDASLTYSSAQVTGDIEKSNFIIDRSLAYNLDFIQIGNTGTI